MHGKRNDDTPQHEAVREAFTNVIIHCDLMMDVDEVELVLPVPSLKSSTTELSNGFSIELPERLSIRLSKELSKGLSETAANIYKMIYADNYITRSEIANRIGISVTAVQKHINKLKSLRFIDRDGSTGHGSWIIIE